MTKTFYDHVGDFHTAFNHPVASAPTPMDEKTALNRTVWEAEELVELLHATVGGDLDKFEELTSQFLDGVKDAITKQKEKEAPEDILTAQADALTDALYFNQGSFNIIGVRPEPLFDIVQQANMGKLWEDGKPRFRESDGKIIKPDNWEIDFAPEGKLKKEIEWQIAHPNKTDKEHFEEIMRGVAEIKYNNKWREKWIVKTAMLTYKEKEKEGSQKAITAWLNDDLDAFFSSFFVDYPEGRLMPIENEYSE
ncbi:hypothetical protein ACI2JA_03330 [Alkalihalobacillus sp. NPDC078783]